MSWSEFINSELDKPYFKKLEKFLDDKESQGIEIYPPVDLTFNAFDLCPLDQIKVVIMGQDPYHGENQAHGLAFSTKSTKIPPSLQNIFKELGIKPEHGHLESWARQGVLLLNRSLTVEKGRPGSHAGIGWEIFTENAVKYLVGKSSRIVFMLWGSKAQEIESLIPIDNLILKTSHPSPYSANKGFLGCSHFETANIYLKSIGKPEIDWCL